MKEVISGREAKAADRYAIDILGIPSLLLMENASFFVADHIIRDYPGADVLIACGTGNNGADGVCIGRMLKEKGYDPLVLCCGNGWNATWEFYHQLSEYRRLDGRLMQMTASMDGLPAADVIVDALFGIGLRREVEGACRELIRLINDHPGVKLCVDVPSGINADTGEEMGISVKADITFTFGRNKTGLARGSGTISAGDVRICDIGIPEEAYNGLSESSGKEGNADEQQFT